MYIIGENIHIISEKVKEALAAKNALFFQDLAVKQVEAGAQALDINLGPRKKDGEEVFPWMVETLEAVVSVPLSFDTTNLVGMEAGLKKCVWNMENIHKLTLQQTSPVTCRESPLII